MPYETDMLELRDHRFGRVNRRMPIGPVRWPFHDLFWIHEGRASMAFPELDARLELVAPSGVLILPGTLFQGAALGAFSTASICHFSLGRPAAGPGYVLPNPDEALHLQNLIRLSLHLARRNRADELPRRKRLLVALLDGFDRADTPQAPAPD